MPAYRFFVSTTSNCPENKYFGCSNTVRSWIWKIVGIYIFRDRASHCDPIQSNYEKWNSFKSLSLGDALNCTGRNLWILIILQKWPTSYSTRGEVSTRVNFYLHETFEIVMKLPHDHMMHSLEVLLGIILVENCIKRFQLSQIAPSFWFVIFLHCHLSLFIFGHDDCLTPLQCGALYMGYFAQYPVSYLNLVYSFSLQSFPSQ